MMMKRIAIPVALVAAAAGGYMLGRDNQSAHTAPAEANARAESAPAAAQQLYTCSMHPQVQLGSPGKCPICGMPLVPASAAQSNTGGANMLELSAHALAMASVETTPVTRRLLTRELRAVGKIEYNEASLATVTTRVDGYAERLFVNFTGAEIKAGDHLAEVYSPELLVAQQELLIALQGSDAKQNDPLVETAQLKLKRWGMTDAQISELVASKKATDRVTLYSPIHGTVIEKSVFENSAFKAGDVLYRVANLDTVWIYLDIYEYDLAWVRYGQTVELSAEALPGRVFEGRVTFVQPIVNEETRTVRVPVHIENRDHALKPGMFVSAVIRSSLAADGGAAATGVEGKFSCPMHPQILQDRPGQCPICEMRLEQIPGLSSTRHPTHPGDGTHSATHGATPSPRASGLLALPVSAVLDSGTRRLVYVERSRGVFEPREVVLGPRAGEFFPVLNGLSENERVVTRGGFLIDSQFQITGRPSLFYPGGLTARDAGHDHGASGAPHAASSAEPGSGGQHQH